MRRTIEAIGTAAIPWWRRSTASAWAAGSRSRASRHPHLRRVLALRRADQQAGLVMAYAEIGSLISLAGEAVAMEILLEGRVFDASEAFEKGLVTRVVADDLVETEALQTAQRIADGAPLVARWHKKFARRLRDPKPLTKGEYLEGFDCFGTEDFQIGYRAFLAKEKPGFKGK
jgi:enoyl-CoA hydratase/carnithine racemase